MRFAGRDISPTNTLQSLIIPRECNIPRHSVQIDKYSRANSTPNNFSNQSTNIKGMSGTSIKKHETRNTRMDDISWRAFASSISP